MSDGVDSHGSGPSSGQKVGWFSFPYSRRLFIILGVLLVAGLSARAMLVPTGFGVTGHYRVDSPAEIAAGAPVMQGKQVCGECHDDEFDKHEKDVHVSVQCENCHGAGAEHVKARRADAPSSEGQIFRALEQANCLACHRRLIARPKLFPTVDPAEHFALVGVSDPAVPCQSCHNPHEPLFLERRVSESRIHPLIHPCTDCHTDKGVETRALPAGHVVTFQCKDCHADVVADAKTKAHGGLDCRTCHLFRKDSEFSGRIFKNGNPRFCLLCHGKQPFKDGKRIPLIESFEAHLNDVAQDDADRAKRCADCHVEEWIHAVKDRKAGNNNVVPPAPATPGQEGE